MTVMNLENNGTRRLCLHEGWEVETLPMETGDKGNARGARSGAVEVEESGGLEYSVSTAYQEGLRRLEDGRLQEAKMIFSLILTACPTHADSVHLLGVIAHQAGRLDQAVDYFERATELRPMEAHYHNNFGNVLRDLDRSEEAVECYRTALRLRPESPEINSNLGNALRDLGRLAEAVEVYGAALLLKPDLAETSFNLGNVLADLGRFEEAEICYRDALVARPGHAETHYSLGNALVALCRPEEAESCYRAALLAKPDYPEACNNLGNVFQELNLLKAAELCYQDALRLRPDYAEAYYNLGCALVPQNNLREATACFKKALALKPESGASRLALCMAHLPVLYSNELEIAQQRVAYEECLRELSEEIRIGKGFEAIADGVGASQPFFLGYQGYNDRELQRLYGSLVCKIMADEYPPVPLASPPSADEKVRVGIVSGFFYEHTVWKLLIEGWVKQLDRSRFEVFGYHTGTRRDDRTQTAETLCDRFVQGCVSRRRWREIIAADAPHVLLYPEIGMDPQSARLAAQRLAPVQCVSWGHPVTTGFPTVDCYLSSELMEPLDGQGAYTERLVRLPNLATFYEPDPVRPVSIDRRELGLRASATVFWSGQSLYKYLPRFDPVFARIAEKVRDSQFVFIEYAKSRRVTEEFRARLRDSFSLLGLDADQHCVILPYLERDRFIGAVGLCDVILDTIGWSGGKSTLDCLTHDLPIVTLPGPLMRSRHTAAILRRLDVTETIADSVNGYVRIAVRLAWDAQRRKTIAKRIAKNKHNLYRDREFLSSLEEFLDLAARYPAGR